MKGTSLLGLVTILIVLGCAAPTVAPPNGGKAQLPSSAAPRPSRSLVFIARSEPSTMGRSGGIGIDTSPRFFNATLMVRDGQGTPQPQLAQALPQLNSDTWRVHADGTMETTYKLKPSLTWHDGAPFTAEDLVFAWQVHRDPRYGPTVGTPGAPPDSLCRATSWSHRISR
jgi:peptide/nickel transport system substrate-binding protein